MKAIFNKTVIAQSDKIVVVEGNNYFPLESINMDYFTETTHRSTCPWKGEASYYTVKVNDEISENAAWFYKNPKDAAKEIKNHVAFWKNVSVEK
ncbi:DUF427 domain-containing protein [Flavobacterium xanthum]|uniref:Uncharacterized conserved protein, DUF427 family n=1 Tax=Flavobacterium xanthum TaxID=69322 RepID=A0A1M7KFA4_9FLAO|nr:DUF427 domain-containing protein [Flavobacterium xanthum]SHM63983.1 Uncharacterized conserved protein, DUF427 family [Flavobacterium xanthum]